MRSCTNRTQRRLIRQQILQLASLDDRQPRTLSLSIKEIVADSPIGPTIASFRENRMLMRAGGAQHGPTLTAWELGGCMRVRNTPNKFGVGAAGAAFPCVCNPHGRHPVCAFFSLVLDVDDTGDHLPRRTASTSPRHFHDIAQLD